MLSLNEEDRERLWSRLIEVVKNYMQHVEELRVAPRLDPSRLRDALRAYDFGTGRDPVESLDFVAHHLALDQVHSPHPRYFGLFNPKPTTMGVAADTLVAVFNPQLAAWSHSPFAAEVERHLVRAFGIRFGFPAPDVDGTLCSGGAEANHTGVLAALNDKIPGFSENGVSGLQKPPVFYASAESHHSFLKAARLCGIGAAAVRLVPVDADLRMDVGELANQIRSDRDNGYLPFMVAGTAGTTGAGVIDPLPAIAEITLAEGLWFHVDAAWGGAAILVPELQSLLGSIEQADSITFDAHKWMSVPMGAGIFLTRHPESLSRTFGTGNTYMPREAAGLDIVDPYMHSIQWSRRFTGLKIFLSLAVVGWRGYEKAIRHQTAMGDLLRDELKANGWRIVNQTALPVVCFVRGEGDEENFLQGVVARVLQSGQAWISTARIGGKPAIRACITNYDTKPEHVRQLVEMLGSALV